MITIQPLKSVSMEALKEIITGYESHERYDVRWHDSLEHVSMELTLRQLDTPYVKQFGLEEEDYYTPILKHGMSLGAYEGNDLVALSLMEPRWNGLCWIHEFHVKPESHGQGIGRQLMDATAQKAKDVGLRGLLVEAQNTNGPAIRFYRRVGFRIEGIDLSLYTNTDHVDGEVALFMKRHLTEPPI